MGRQLLNRDITSLIRTTPQTGDTPPQIASLVSHKFQLTINVTSRAFQKAEYSYQVKSIDRVYGRQGRIPQIEPLHEPYNVVNKGKRKIDEASGPSMETPLQLTYSTTTAQSTRLTTTDYKQSEEQGTPIPTTSKQNLPPSKSIEQSPTSPESETERTTDTQENRDSTARRTLFKEQSSSTQSVDTKTDTPTLSPTEHKNDTPKPTSKDIKAQASHEDTKKSVAPKRTKKT